ncbi:hypothetical protein F2P79_002801 [Pimephales promelas]|nr:hypothetical protein F2P79_002801 [Pimephales promelas]
MLAQNLGSTKQCCRTGATMAPFIHVKLCDSDHPGGASCSHAFKAYSDYQNSVSVDKDFVGGKTTTFISGEF